MGHLTVAGMTLGLLALGWVLTRRDMFNATWESAWLAGLRMGAIGVVALALLLVMGERHGHPSQPLLVVGVDGEVLQDPANAAVFLDVHARLAGTGPALQWCFFGPQEELGLRLRRTLVPGAPWLEDLREAATWVRSQGAGRLVAISPAPPTDDWALAAGVPAEELRWVALKAPPPAPGVGGLSLPPAVLAGREREARARFTAIAPEHRVSLAADGTPVADRGGTVAGHGGLPEWVVTVPPALETTAESWVTVTVEGADGTLLDRQSARSRVWQVARVHYVAHRGAADPPLEELLRGSGFDVSRLSPDQLGSLVHGDLTGGGHLVILDDLLAGFLGSSVLAGLAGAVAEHGVGVLAVVGPNSAADYAGGLFESLLPISFSADDEEDGDIALTVVTDTSMSMRVFPHGANKIDLVREALLNLSVALPAEAAFGILGVAEQPYWITPLDRGQPLGRLQDQILRIRAEGGGINLYSGLLEAYRAVSVVDDRRRHVLVFLDTADVDEYAVAGVGDVWDLLAEMRRAGITTSFIGFGFGVDRHVPFLHRLATTAGGYFYLASRLEDIPTFAARDLEQVQADPVRRGATRVLFAEDHFAGFTELPSLDGYVMASPRPAAEVPVKTAAGDPVFAVQRFGRGRIGVFAADSGGALAAPWMESPRSAELWDRLLAALAPEVDPAYRLYTEPRRDGAAVYVRGGVGQPPPGLMVRTDRGGTRPVTFTPLGAGEHLATIEAGGPSRILPAATGGPGGDPVAEGSPTRVPPAAAGARSLDDLPPPPEPARAGAPGVLPAMALLALGLYAVEEVFRTV